MPAPVPPSPPPLTDREHTLLAAFIAARSSLAVFLASTPIAPAELHAFLTSPAVKAHLAALLELTHAALTLRAAEARHVAITALESLVAAAEDPIEKRRAAATLFRATASPLIPLRASRSAAEDAPDETDQTPRPARTPSPRLSAQDAASAVFAALADNHAPDTDSGLATLLAFCAGDAVITGETVRPTDSAFPPTLAEEIEALADAPVADAIDADDFWILQREPEAESPSDTTARLILRVAANATFRHYALTLHRAPDTRHPHCWLITTLTTHADTS